MHRISMHSMSNDWLETTQTALNVELFFRFAETLFFSMNSF